LEELDASLLGANEVECAVRQNCPYVTLDFLPKIVVIINKKNFHERPSNPLAGKTRRNSVISWSVVGIISSLPAWAARISRTIYRPSPEPSCLRQTAISPRWPRSASVLAS